MITLLASEYREGDQDRGAHSPLQTARRTLDQNDLLQAACGDLARGLTWFGWQLSQDEWRWLICAAVLGIKIVPGISLEGERAGVVTLGGSSRRLNKEQGTRAISLAFAVGDTPWDYEPTQKEPVQWGPAVRLARGIPDSEEPQ